MDSYPSMYLSKHVIFFWFLFSLYLSSLNPFISNPMNNDAGAVHLIHFLFEFSLHFFFFSWQRVDDSGVIGNVPTPRCQLCVIIPLEKNNGVTWDTPTPLNRKKSFQSFLFLSFWMPKRGEKETKNLQTYTFQTWKRNLIRCIPNPKTSKFSWLRLEVSFGSFRLSQRAWMFLAGDPLWRFYSVHPAVNKLKEWC